MRFESKDRMDPAVGARIGGDILQKMDLSLISALGVGPFFHYRNRCVVTRASISRVSICKAIQVIMPGVTNHDDSIARVSRLRLHLGRPKYAHVDGLRNAAIRLLEKNMEGLP